MPEDAFPNNEHSSQKISPVDSVGVESDIDRASTRIDNSHPTIINGNIEVNNGDFVAGDKYVNSFSNDSVRLSHAYIRPHSVFDRFNLEHFIGREWLLAKVDAFLQNQNHDRGYFIIKASAGLGKTAFMAWLTKQRKYIHHFCELSPGLEGVGDSLKSLAAQLVSAYELRSDNVLPSVASRPDYFYDLLTQAANRRRDDEKIVIVVDALDEAGTPKGQNVLGLPTGLPKGVFLLSHNDQEQQC